MAQERARRWTLAAVGILVVALSACDSDPTDVPSPIIGKTWELRSYGPIGQEDPVIAGTVITATFGDDGRVRGNGGCNDYWADFEILEPDGLVLDGDFANTESLCGLPHQVLDQEDEYFDALRAAVRFVVTGDTLEVVYGDGSRHLVFDEQPR